MLAAIDGKEIVRLSEDQLRAMMIVTLLAGKFNASTEIAINYIPAAAAVVDSILEDRKAQACPF